MMGLLVLATALLWVTLCIWAGVAVFRHTGKRWAQVVCTGAVLWLPFWDVVPGWFSYRSAVHDLGGVRIRKAVQAEGYLSGSADRCFDCWRGLKGSGFQYIEVERIRPSGLFKHLETQPGFYEYRLAERSSEQCARVSGHFEYFDSVGLRQFCVVSTRRDTAKSRYLTNAHGWVGLRSRRVLDGFHWPEVEVTSQTVSDRASGEVVAEAHAVRYIPWIGQFLPLPGWQHAGRASFDVAEVISPRHAES